MALAYIIICLIGLFAAIIAAVVVSIAESRRNRSLRRYREKMKSERK